MTAHLDWTRYEIEPVLTQKLWTQFVCGMGLLGRTIAFAGHDREDEDRYARFSDHDWLTLGERLP